MPGMGELIVILLIVLVVFGANKLPQIGDALGRSIKNFKRSSKVEDELEEGEGDAKAREGKSLPAGKPQRQLEASREGDAGGEEAEWEEVVVRRRKKPASSES